MATVQQNYTRAQQMAQLQSVPQHLRQFIADEAIKSQKTVLSFPYFSKVRLRATVTGANPNVVYTIDTTVRKAFGYGVGQAMDAAGFAAATAATEAETNVLSGGNTRNNSDVIIWGLACEIGELSDPMLVREVWDNTNVDLTLNGTDTHQLGRLAFFPQAGGLNGMGRSDIASPNTFDSVAAPMGFLTNGLPQAGNYFKFPQALRWNAIGKGKKDSTLSIIVRPTRTITVNQTRANRVAVAANATATTSTSGCEAWTTPEAAQVDLIFRLICVSISERSETT